MTAKKSEKMIYVGELEELASLVRNLLETEEQRVVFVFPEKSKVAQNSVNLKVLKREAESVGKDIFILNSGTAAQQLALASKISLFGEEHLEEPRVYVPQRSVKMMDIMEPRRVAVRSDESRDSSFKSVEAISFDQGDNDSPEHVAAEEAQEDVFYEEPKSRPLDSGVLSAQEDEFVSTSQQKKITEDASEDFFDTFKIGHQPIIRKKRSSLTTALVVFAGAALAVFLVAIYFLFSKVQIDIAQKKEIVPFKIGIEGSQGAEGVKAEESMIPAAYVSIPKNDVREFPATGTKIVEEKARGTIVISNAFNSTPQTLVATTRFLSKDGKTFRLIKTVPVPGAKVEDGKIVPSTVDASVIADQPGEEYNIAPTEFTIPGFQGTPKYETFTARSSSQMTGGARGEKKIVTKEDIEKARKTVVDNLTGAAEVDLAASVGENYKLLDEAKRATILNFSTSAIAGTVSDKFTASAEFKLEAILFKVEDTNKIIEYLLQKMGNKEIEINWGNQVLEFNDVKPDFVSKSIQMVLVGNIETREKVDADLLKDEIAGKSIDELKSVLYKNPSIEESKIVLTPSWLRNVPSDKSRINITIEQ
jgi:hypothetical protein